MEQVTEAVKEAETTEHREHRDHRKPAVKWLIIGWIVSLAASGIFTASSIRPDSSNASALLMFLCSISTYINCSPTRI